MSAAVPHPRLAARRARTRSIRLTIVALAVALFLCLWALIFGVLASGHDPGLTAKHASATQSATSATSSGSSGSTDSLGSSGSTDSSGSSGFDSSGSSSGSDSSGSGSSSSAPSLSTHQS
ncbi:MAG TPA: hypothetical protein VH231_04285 [Solirubrobacteraceae bacterium]|nr:hypothetical protein [Solirubrobacteraceae bacterium]